MKTNAIIRIIIWSLVIITLLGILSIGLGVTRILPSRTIAASPVESIAPQRIEETHVPQRIEETHPEKIEVTSPNMPDEPVATAPNDSGNTQAPSVEAASIRDISIEWVAGRIQILPIDGDVIRFYETGDTEKYPMVAEQRKDKLKIQYCQNKSPVSIGISTDLSKDLTIELPKDFLLKELDIDAASATVLVQNVSIQNMEFDGGSGECQFIECNIDTLDVDTASGNIYFTGSLQELDCDAASASFKGTLSNIPRRIEMDSMSGDLDVTLPEDAGFTVTMEGMKSDFTSDFDVAMRNGSYVSGNGSCRIEMDAMSGDVIIRKAK